MIGTRTVALGLLVVAWCLVTVVQAAPALAHAELSPTTAAPGEDVRMTVTSIVERDRRVNGRLDVVIDEAFEVRSCTAPDGWDCVLDTGRHAPHTTARYQPRRPALRGDVIFDLDVVMPSEPGTWMVRVLQVHDDGWVEPWLYGQEPYIAPRVQVGGDATIRNGEDAPGQPCLGPQERPTGYAGYDGEGDERAPCPRAATSTSDPIPTPDPSPTPDPTPTPTASPTPTPVTTTSTPAPVATSTPTPTPTVAAPPTATAAAPSPTPSDAPVASATGPDPTPTVTRGPVSSSAAAADRSSSRAGPVLVGVVLLAVAGTAGGVALRRSRS